MADEDTLEEAATCTEPAVYYLSCTCGKTGNATFTYGEALGHKLIGEWEITEEVHWKWCDRCDEQVEEAHIPDHEGGATEEYAVICTVCEYVIEEQLEHTHVWGEPEFLWSDEYDACTAVFICETCEGEQSVECTIRTEVVREPTSDETGLVEHTASCEWNGEIWTDTVEEEVTAPASISLSVSDMTIRAGQTAEMTVSLDNVPAGGLGILRLEIAYDDTLLELVGAEGTDQNPYIVLWDADDNLNEAGDILKLTFRAKKVEEVADLGGLVTIRCIECSDLEQNDIECTIGVYETEFLLPGDLNGDGIVNGKDVILVRQYVALMDVEMDLRTADVNADGEVNGKDVILIRQYVAMFEVELQ